MNGTVIRAHGLTRYFGSTCVVRDLNLELPRGSVLALLGRNGSGKTTSIRMLLGLLEPTRGSSSVLGHDSRRLPPAVRARVGYLSERSPVHGWMRVREAGKFHASLYRRWDQALFEAVMDYFAIHPRTRTGKLSRGQRVGFCLARALAPQPELLVLDDPTLGLDPVARQTLLEAMIYFTREDHRTILFSSHDLAMVERVADHLALLDRGEVRLASSVDAFRQRVRQVVIQHGGESPVLSRIPGLLSVERSAEETLLVIGEWNERTEAVLEGAVKPQAIEVLPMELDRAITRFLERPGEKGSFLSRIGGKR